LTAAHALCKTVKGIEDLFGLKTLGDLRNINIILYGIPDSPPPGFDATFAKLLVEAA